MRPAELILDWRAGFLLACELQSLVLAAALWGADRREVRPLAGALLVLTGVSSVYVLGWRGHAEPPDWLALIPTNLPLALGPLLYLYARGIAGEPPPPHRWRHFLPAAIQFTYLAGLLVLVPTALRHEWKETWHDHAVKPLVELAVLVSLAGYTAASIRLLRRSRARRERERSDADRYAGRWLSRLLATLLVTLAALAALRVYTNFVAEIDAGAFQLWLGIWAVWLGVEGWRTAAQLPPPAAEPVEPPGRGERNWAALGEAWRARTEAAGWWREPDLTLADLARRLGTNAAYLSRAVNDGLGMNFNEMINQMRAREVARRIDAGELPEGDLLRAAIAAGFSSKATFNRAFRATTGASPSEYRRLKS